MLYLVFDGNQTKTILVFPGLRKASPEQVEAFSANMIPAIPMKRFGKADEVAKAVT